MRAEEAFSMIVPCVEKLKLLDSAILIAEEAKFIKNNAIDQEKILI